MSLTPSKRFINWSNASFTPAGGTAIPIPGIISCTIDRGVTYVTDSGDGEYYDSFAGAVSAKPKATIQTNKPAILDTIPVGTLGIFAITRNDATNGAAVGGGALLYALNSVFDPGNQAGSHRQLGNGGGSFMGISTDGITNPLSVSPVAS